MLSVLPECHADAEGDETELSKGRKCTSEYVVPVGVVPNLKRSAARFLIQMLTPPPRLNPLAIDPEPVSCPKKRV